MEHLTITFYPENLSAEERETFMELAKKASKEPIKAWKPIMDEVYWYMDGEGVVCKTCWGECGTTDLDEDSYAIGNCFKTEVECERAAERLKVVAELKRFAVEHNEPNGVLTTYLAYDTKLGVMGYVNFIGNPADTWFTSQEVAAKAIVAVGEERIKKYYFGIED